MKGIFNAGLFMALFFFAGLIDAQEPAPPQPGPRDLRHLEAFPQERPAVGLRAAGAGPAVR